MPTVPTMPTAINMRSFTPKAMSKNLRKHHISVADGVESNASEMWKESTRMSDRVG